MITNIIQAYLTIADYNISSADQYFGYVATVVPIFIPLMLFSLFIIISLATYFSKKRLTGFGDFPASFAVAGFVTTITAVLLSLFSNVINPLTIGICIIVTVIGVIWLFFSRESS